MNYLTQFASIVTASAFYLFANPVHAQTPAPLAHYPMEGGVTDIAGANQDQPSGFYGLTFVPGQRCQGVTFDQPPQGTVNGGYIEIPHQNDLATMGNQFTFEAWVQPYGIGPNDDFFGSVIMQKVRDKYFAYATYWRSDEKFMFLVGVTDGVENIISQNNFPAGTLNHVVGTYDGQDFKLFVNGVLEGQLNRPGATIDYSGPHPWTIGATPTYFQSIGYPRTFNGVIDEVKIYGQALTQPEIQSEYNSGLQATLAITSSVLPVNPEAFSYLVDPNNGSGLRPMVDVGWSGATTGGCMPVTTEVRVWSNEPNGSGLNSPDATFDAMNEILELRAQVSGNGNGGRTYIIVVKATDYAGNPAFSCTTVGVPKLNTHFWRQQVHNVGLIAINDFLANPLANWSAAGQLNLPVIPYFRIL